MNQNTYNQNNYLDIVEKYGLISVLINNKTIEAFLFNKIFLINLNESLLNFIDEYIANNLDYLKQRFIEVEEKIGSGIFKSIFLNNKSFDVTGIAEDIITSIDDLCLRLDLIFDTSIINDTFTKNLDKNISILTNTDIKDMSTIRYDINDKNVTKFIYYIYFETEDEFLYTIYRFSILKNLEQV